MSGIIQRSFAGGEIAPSLWARADQTKYATGLKTCRNFVVHKHGGVSNRAGTEFVIETKDSTRQSRLVPFKYSINQTYAIEFGHNYIRFVKDGAQILVTNTDAPAWSGATNYTVGDLTTSGGTRYYCKVAHINFIPPNATYWYALTGNILEVPTTYAEADLFSLRLTQSADVITIAHVSYDTANLSRFSNVKWTLVPEVFVPAIGTPAGSSAVNGTAGTTVYRYKVIAIDNDTGEESLPSASFSCTGGVPTLAAPNVITIGAVTGADFYYVYKEITPGNGAYGWIGIAASTTFNDNNISPLSGERPPENKTPFTGAGNKPSLVGYFQGRRIYAATTNNPEIVVMSKSDIYNNLMISTPLRDDDSVTFNLAGTSVNKVVGIIGLRTLIMLTEEGEWTVGDPTTVITPGNINPVQQSSNGAASLHPLLIGSEVLYVQTHGSIVHSLGFDLATDGYKGDDVTLFATHLFKGRTVVDWAYSKTPDSIVWAIMSDGALLGLTYIKSQQLWGWHKHDTAASGLFESTIAISEGREDAAYFIVNRIINGVEKRYIERMHSREVVDVVLDSFFVDCGLTYDGRNLNAALTITITGGTLWDHTENLTATASAAYFTAGDVGNRIVMDDGTGVKQKFDITAYTSTTVVTVRSVNNVAVGYRGVALSNFSRAVDTISGLGHLEGEALSILGDGYVVANGVDAPLMTATAGVIADLGGFYSVIHAGLPITADMETLAIDSDDQKTVLNKESLVTNVNIMVESSRGIFAGPDADHLFEYKQRSDEDYSELTALVTGLINIGVDSTYCKGGQIFIQQKDPLPVTVLAVIPNGNLGGGG